MTIHQNNQNTSSDLINSRLGIRILGTTIVVGVVCFSMILNANYDKKDKNNKTDAVIKTTQVIPVIPSNMNNIYDAPYVLQDKIEITKFTKTCYSQQKVDTDQINGLIKKAKDITKKIELPNNKVNTIQKDKNLSYVQQKNVMKAYHIGNQIKAKDGTSFGITLAGIMAQESSYGIKMYNTTTFHRIKTSVGAFQMHIPTARFIIKEYELIKYDNLNDTELAHKLAHDFEFSAVLAALYLKRNYEIALSFHKNPWRATVSRYNGGWYNTEYLALIIKRMETVQDVIKTFNT